PQGRRGGRDSDDRWMGGDGSRYKAVVSRSIEEDADNLARCIDAPGVSGDAAGDIDGAKGSPRVYKPMYGSSTIKTEESHNLARRIDARGDGVGAVGDIDGNKTAPRVEKPMLARGIEKLSHNFARCI